MNVLEQLAKFGLRFAAPPVETDIARFCDGLDFNLDDDFRELIFASDGATGFVGDDAYIQIWPLEDMRALNPYYADVEVCKNLFFFASDGSSTGYAFSKSTGEVVSIEYIDIGIVEPVKEADSFMNFLRQVSS